MVADNEMLSLPVSRTNRRVAERDGGVSRRSSLEHALRNSPFQMEAGDWLGGENLFSSVTRPERSWQ